MNRHPKGTDPRNTWRHSIAWKYKEMLDWIPIAFITFKVVVFGTGMFLAIKWHYDQGKKGQVTDKRAMLRTARKVGVIAVVFVILLVGLLYVTFAVSRNLGLT